MHTHLLNMKITSAAVLLVAATPIVKSQESQPCIATGFTFSFDGECNKENLEERFKTDVFDVDGNVPESCTNTAAQEFAHHVDPATIPQLCVDAYDDYRTHHAITFENEVTNAGEDFVNDYYDGGTWMNEEVETMYPTDEDGDATNRLRASGGGDGAFIRNIYEGPAQYGMIGWPGYVDNFDLDKCAINAAYCCWVTDRQANDNNGNCATPYDANCVDKDPADNVNVCHADLNTGVVGTNYTGSDGYAVYPLDNNVGEGDVHCHGLAWANDGADKSAAYKGNNLFYISMYDHLHQRGYVRNIEGAPMCACAEHMPTVERADCTQIDLEHQSFQFMLKPDKSASITLEEVDIVFNSCQGKDSYGKQDNNDLWSYMNQLWREGKVTSEQFVDLNKKLVGELQSNRDRCDHATEEYMASQGYIEGYNHDKNKWELVAGKGVLQDPGLGKVGFKLLFDEAPKHDGEFGQIIKRVCTTCYPDHQVIYYKRHTEVPEDEDLLWNLRKHNGKTDYNTWQEDFDMYSSYEEAVNGVNEWKCRNNAYDYGHRFPGCCSPSGSKICGQDTIFNDRHGQRNVAYYIEVDAATASPRVSPTNPTGYAFQEEEVLDVGYPDIPGAARTYTTSTNDTVLYVNSYGYYFGDWQPYRYTSSGDDDYYDEFTMYGDAIQESDKFSIVVKLENFTAPNYWSSRVGLMIREDPMTPKSKFSAILMRKHGDIFAQQRSVVGKRAPWLGSTYIKDQFNDNGVFMRLKYDANYVHYDYSFDGDDWIALISPVQMTFGPNVHAGVVVSSADSQPAEGVFSNMESIAHVCTATEGRKLHLYDGPSRL